MRYYITALLVWSLALCGWLPLAQAIERNALSAALDSVTTEDLRKHVDFLADDSLEGREAGSRGGRAAGNFLMQLLEKQGLKPAGESGSWFQTFNGSCRNVLAWKEGSDPALSNELILVGAHYDHVGYGSASNSYGPFGHVHNGADDNASGVAAVLELIDAVQKLPQAPKRSLVFAFWDSEEKGLDGSKAWVARPTLAGKRVRLAINLDMVGRLRKQLVEVYGIRSAPGLRELVSRSNRDDLDLDFTWTMREDSDHYPFFKAGIPSLMLHTGLHDNYHRPSDDVHLLNVEGMRQVTRCVLGTMLLAAEAPQLPEFRRAAQSETLGREPAPPAAAPNKPRLGVTWRELEIDQQPVLEVATLSSGLPAEQAGVKLGDRLLTFNGKSFADDRSLRVAILGAEGSATLGLARAGQGEPVEIVVPLAGKPVRIGITWREDDAEPSLVILTSVVSGSAASNAGLRPRDRIMEVNGQTFADAATFTQLLKDSRSPLSLLVERRGRVFPAELELAPD